MNTDNDELREALRIWKPDDLNVAEIRRSVWHSIEQSRSRPFQGVIEQVLTWIGQPTVSVVILMVSLVAGLSVGITTSSHTQTGLYLDSLISFLP